MDKKTKFASRLARTAAALRNTATQTVDQKVQMSWGSAMRR